MLGSGAREHAIVRALLSEAVSKLAGVELSESADTSTPVADVVDLMAALKASVEAARRRREDAQQAKAG